MGKCTYKILRISFSIFPILARGIAALSPLHPLRLCLRSPSFLSMVATMPKKSTAPKQSRTCRLPETRVTQEERDTIKDRARKAGLTQSEYQRRACLDGKIIVHDTGLRVAAVRELSAIGNNLNQLTRKTHIHGAYEREIFERVITSLDTAIMQLIEDE
jgi:ubiquitin